MIASRSSRVLPIVHQQSYINIQVGSRAGIFIDVRLQAELGRICDISIELHSNQRSKHTVHNQGALRKTFLKERRVRYARIHGLSNRGTTAM